MTRPRDTKRRFRFVSRSRENVRSEIQDELAFHLDMRAADLMREGLSEAAARAQAHVEFGDAAGACVRRS